LNCALHVAPQAIPAGLLDTEPEPDPVLLTDNEGFGLVANVAVTVVLDVNVT
jgi:hypothetical protein